jgi:hypothetical protein
MKFKTAVQIFVGGIVILAIVMALVGFEGGQIDNVINWLIPIGISFMLSAFVGEWLEVLTGDFFKEIYLSFPVWKFRVNIPLFVILVFLIKVWWFG